MIEFGVDAHEGLALRIVEVDRIGGEGRIEAFLQQVDLLLLESSGDVVVFADAQEYRPRIFGQLLREIVAQELPEYARPVFLRIRKNNDVTTTFKQKKINLLKEGFDPTLTVDPIYFNDPQRKAFVRVDPELYERIKSGEVRL